MSEATERPGDEQAPPAEVPDEQNERIREERLDPDNRPEGAEVDNTERTFDEEAGMFTDNPEYSEEERPFATAEDDDEGDEGEQ